MQTVRTIALDPAAPPVSDLARLVQAAEVGGAPPQGEFPDDDIPLYAPRRKIYPQSTHGTFRRIKWAVLLVTLGIYYLLPFVRWDRGPNAPSQAVLIDFPNRRFYFFFIELWPQEIYYLTGLLILAAIVLFLMNAIAGRVWCGYLCPQTVWTDLFFTIERFFEGDRREHMRSDAQKWTARNDRQQGRQAFHLADGGVVDRRRLGVVFRRRADPGEGPGDRTRAVRGLSLDRHSDLHHLYARRPYARAGLPLHVPVAAHPGGADRRIRAQCHLSLRPRRAALLGQEGRAIARPRPAGRRLRRVPAMRPRLPDRRRYSRRRQSRLHPVRALHRRLRQRDGEARPRQRPDRL